MKWVVADGGDADRASSSESDEDEELAGLEADYQALGDGDQRAQEAAGPPAAQPKAPKERISIKLGAAGADACHVCGQRGHTAGFVGARYIDCPNKPCYLCGTQGHSTMTCPFRIAPGHGCTTASEVNSDSLLVTLRKREGGAGRLRPLPQRAARRWQVEAAVLKLHSRRVACLEFHPRHPSLVVSGDKRGQVAVWDFDKVYERTVYNGINRWLTNALRFMPGGDGSACATASHDGTVKIFDVETGDVSRVLYTANARHWDTATEEDDSSWVTMLALDVMPQAGLVVAGDSIGRVHLLDPRASQPVASLQIHKKNTKVQSLHANPVDPNLLLSAGNDYQARLLDVRCLVGSASAGAEAASPPGSGSGKGKGRAGPSGHPAELACLPHPRIINSAYFSPVSGRKILTTCQDNRIRVWDYLLCAEQAADREIVHSQNFNRYLTPFRAEWDPKDPAERLLVCGRYISEDFGGVALHPVDLLDAATGALVGELTDPNLTTISPVNKPHPTRDVIVGGSSRSLFAWFAVPEDGGEEGEGGKSARAGAGAGSARPGRRTMDDLLPFGVQSSGDFVFFDADDDVDAAKKKKRGAKTAGSSAAQQEASPGSGRAKAKAQRKSPASKAQQGKQAQQRKRKKGEEDSDDEAGE